MVRSSVASPTSVDEARKDMERRGAVTVFVCRPISHIECQRCGHESQADPELLHGLHRVVEEGQDSIVALLRCPHCRSLGTVVITDGPASREEEAGVLAALLNQDNSGFVVGR